MDSQTKWQNDGVKGWLVIEGEKGKKPLAILYASDPFVL